MASSDPSKNIRQIQRYITTHTKDGKTTFSNALPDDAPFQALPDGAEFALCYATDQFPVQLRDDGDVTRYKEYTQNLPGITIDTGSVLRVVDMRPGALSPMHRTISVDYGVVLEGEVEIMLDSGESRVLKRGDITVQRGTNHAWRNVSETEWARMLDLLKRHAAGHEADASNGKRTKRYHHQGPRVSRACKACATAKLKCDNEKPCARCQQRGFVSLPEPESQLEDLIQHDMSGFLRGVITPTVTDAMPPPDWLDLDSFGPRGLLDFTIDGCPDFDDSDLGFLDQLCNNSSTINLQPHFSPVNNDGFPGPGSTRKHVALGVEAFSRSSLGNWLPDHQDHGDAEFEHLSILSVDGSSPDTRLKLDSRYLVENVSRTARDDVLAMVLATCRPERISTVTKAFPQPELLEDLTQSFFSHYRRRPDSYVHVPSFRPNAGKPDLLAVIAGAGALLTDITSLHKLGLAFQEAVRHILPRRCEEANAITRELWIVQTFMVLNESGLWSGIKRKMELAESHTQVLYTMLRRAGRFQRSKPITVFPEDTGDALHSKWLRWVKQESLKRLVFHAFVFDAQVCMALLTNPAISYAELDITLPESEALWAAEDAQQWKALYLAQARPRDEQLTLMHFLQASTELPQHCDVHFSGLIILHGIWGMVWQHLEQVSALKGSAQSLAFLTLRHQDLLQTIQHFRINIFASQENPSPETCMTLELLPMYLHSSLKETQLFAGKGDVEDARRVLPCLQQWVGSSHSRQAVWHAGQVLRAARDFPLKQLREFYAIAVYHAGLILWSYGVVSHIMAVRENTTLSPLSQAGPVIRLDGLDSPALPAIQQFITLGKGTPGISPYPGSDGFPSSPGLDLAPLSDPEAAMGVVVAVLSGNFPGLQDGEAPPSLVENLVQLLQDLGKAAGSVGS
ncbi:hypothetical protein ACJ41O_006379 [Fusarium nematophilum]